MALTKAQRKVRATGITATDMRAITGLDPYGRGKHDVYIAKVLGEETWEPNEAQELGLAIEPIVVKRVAAARGLRVLRIAPSQMTRVHPSRLSHIATPDAFFVANDSVVPDGHPEHADATGQVKVVSPFHAEGWGKSETEIPDWCRVQVAWEQHVTEIGVSHVGALIWPAIRTYTIARDLELEGELVEEADRFMVDHVLAKKPPPVDGSEGSARLLKRLHPRSNGATVKASPSAEEHARMYFQTKRELEHAQQMHEMAKQFLQEACADFEELRGDGWRLRLAWREGYQVTPKPYEVPGARRFDMREVGKR